MVWGDLGHCCSCHVSTLNHAGVYCSEISIWGKRPLTCWRVDMLKAEGKREHGSSRNICPAGCIQPAKIFMQPGSCLCLTPIPGHRQWAAFGWAAPALRAAVSCLLLSWNETCSEDTSMWHSSPWWKNTSFVNWDENEGNRGEDDVITPTIKFLLSCRNMGAWGLWYLQGLLKLRISPKLQSLLVTQRC